MENIDISGIEQVCTQPTLRQVQKLAQGMCGWEK